MTKILFIRVSSDLGFRCMVRRVCLGCSTFRILELDCAKDYSHSGLEFGSSLFSVFAPETDDLTVEFWVMHIAGHGCVECIEKGLGIVSCDDFRAFHLVWSFA